MAKTKICKGCGAEIYKGVKKCPQCGKKNKKYTLVIIIGILLLLIVVKAISNSISERKERQVKYEWPTMGIALLLPQPESEYGRINSDSDTYFSIDIYNVEISVYRDYVAECKEKGFLVDYSSADLYYYANDATGNSLSVYYDDEDDEMSISLSAFKEPVSVKESESVEETKKTDDTINTEENSTEVIEGEEVKNEENKEETTPNDTAQEKTALENDMTFRAWVDSYEAFMNEYVDFIKKFSESDSSDLTLLLSYADYTSKYAEFMEKTGEIDESELTVKDYAYYMEAQARVLKKLSEIQ